MKKVLCSLLLLLVSASIYAHEQIDSITISFDEDEFSLIYNNFNQLKLNSAKYSLCFPDYNKPGLPLISQNIALAGSRNYISHTYTTRMRLIQSDVEIAPSPNLIPANINREVIIDDYRIEYKETDYINSICFFEGKTNWPGFTVFHFYVSPFYYNVKEKNLYLIESINIIFHSEEVIIDRSPQSEEKLETLRSIVINPEIMDSTEHIQTIETRSENHERVEYLIITNEELKSSFISLLNWKKKRAFMLN